MIILKYFWEITGREYFRQSKKCSSIMAEDKCPSAIRLYYMEAIFQINMFLTNKIRTHELRRLNPPKVRKYYNVYGADDTMKHFKLSEKALEEILKM